MTRISVVLMALVSLAVCPLAQALDYSKIERTLAKPPDNVQAPKCVLLLFGNEAKLRIWVVLDGPTVYLDRDANGDLTGEGERFARMEDLEGVEIADPDGKTSYHIEGVSTFEEKKESRQYLRVSIEIKGPLAYRQYCGVELKGSGQEASVAHFHGPLSVGPLRIDGKIPPDLALVRGDQPTDMRGYVGTIDPEHGCWVVVYSHQGQDSAFPKGVHPVLEVEFSSKELGGATIKKRYPLDEFC